MWPVLILRDARTLVRLCGALAHPRSSGWGRPSPRLVAEPFSV